MMRFGSESFRTLKKLSECALWANESSPNNFYRLVRSNLAERQWLKKQNDSNTFCFMNQYSITPKGRQELDDIETRERIKQHEERYFCF